MDSESAFLNDPFDFEKSKLRGVVFGKRTTSDESEVIKAEDNRVEYRAVAGVKRTIDENVAIF
ncbi:MAG TPA: hypothetical protein VMH05_23265 [Bryobacteraceae bacterium]|nr:hypothetical protein [Bryobacteraceae bacterium]